MVDEAAAALGGLDVVVANAGVAAQLPLVGGDPAIFERTMRVNVLGTYYTLRAAGPHISHPGGYAVAIASLGGAVHVPLLGAYSASKAAVEALGNTLRQEVRGAGRQGRRRLLRRARHRHDQQGLRHRGGRPCLNGKAVTRVTPLSAGIDALERGIARRSRRIVAPWWVAGRAPHPDVAQRVVEVGRAPRPRRGPAHRARGARRAHHPAAGPTR